MSAPVGRRRRYYGPPRPFGAVLLALRFRGMFWFATVVGQAVFLGGVAAVNAREILKDKMYLFDVLMSPAHIGLLMVYDPLGAVRFSAPTRRRRRFGASS